MIVSQIPAWKKAPFIRLLGFLLAGVLFQFYLPLPVRGLWITLLSSIFIILCFFFIPFFSRFRFLLINGIATLLALASLGALLTNKKDIRKHPLWIGRSYTPGDALIVSLDEPPQEKARSYKANCTLSYLVRKNVASPVKGRLILYFQKDSLGDPPKYGDRLLIKKPLQEIRSSGNPGSFDYKRFCIFQDISHQVYLKTAEFEILLGKKKHWLNEFLYDCQHWILTILRTYIHPDKEAGLAEALLIGYKNDLDKTLVQSYTNTGVVHIIAISGLHLGLIYWLLLKMFLPLQRNRRTRWLSPVLVITGLWLFTLLAGAQPSVLRSAIMFSCIALAQGIDRRTSIYNSLAFSAMVLLCFNPFWLWDVGFQLSYAAVLSIVVFNRAVYNIFYFKNKLLDLIWKMNAVTLAAQLLTIPVSLYHFHQFPNYFLLTNFVAVPLSSLILIAEIALCCISFIPVVAAIAGKAISWLIWLMNFYIESIERAPFALTNDIQVSLLQAIVLTFFIIAFAHWLMARSIRAFKVGLLALTLFIGIRARSFWMAERQQKIIVYNIPQHQAIDIIEGRKSYFVGDSSIRNDQPAIDFYCKPSRILYRAQPIPFPLPIDERINYLSWHSRKIIWLRETSSFLPTEKQEEIDLLVISGNPRLYLATLLRSLRPRKIVFDATASSWKLRYWKKDCDSLHIPWHDVTLQGAFVMNLN